MSKIALITGINGYIAARTALTFLQAGYLVRGTARSLSSTAPLLAAIPADLISNLEIVEVPDITSPGAFDKAVKGVTTIAHLASPVSLSFTDPEPVLKAAVEGALRVLESAITEPSVQSFIFMSSVAAITDSEVKKERFDETDWNDSAERVVRELGDKTPGHVIYFASKTAAERAVWKFRDEQKPGFKIAAVNPVFVAGPPVVVPESKEKIHGTTKLISDVYSGVELAKAGIPGASSYVDVRDVARVILFGAENPDKVDGERFLLSGYHVPAQAVADILRERYPERNEVIERGEPGKGYEEGYGYPKERFLDGSKVVRVTGEGYTPWEKTVVDFVESVKAIL
ncbi:putative oxidoreductase [Triangularia verruculosa]|uniref:Oxidoreductase n=1 Tax=Triangularia verruculosa TaxID=2587418 RepID=A0AAN7ASI7_9PEZI|nr:putative oxidoreductase [Triangularia verruculosa]